MCVCVRARACGADTRPDDARVSMRTHTWTGARARARKTRHARKMREHREAPPLRI